MGMVNIDLFHYFNIIVSNSSLLLDLKVIFSLFYTVTFHYLYVMLQHVCYIFPIIHFHFSLARQASIKKIPFLCIKIRQTYY